MLGKVVALHLKPEAGILLPVDELSAVAGRGFLGDRCLDKPESQALLMSTESLSRLGYDPGELREQITVELAVLRDLLPGASLQIGTVTLTITKDCTPCTRMAGRLGEDPASFKSKTEGDRGKLARVESSGTIRIGDSVQVIHG